MPYKNRDLVSSSEFSQRLAGNLVLTFPAMKTSAILFLAATFTACQAHKSSYTSTAGVPIPNELISDTIVRVPIATHNIVPGSILQASDISYVQLSETNAPPHIPNDIIGHKTVLAIAKGEFIMASRIDPQPSR